MNSLKTIYSRLTTHDDSIAMLEELGIAIQTVNEQGETVNRTGSQILGDLAGRWDTLTNAQQQSIGVTVAGRHQLSRLTDIKAMSLVA